MNKIKKALKLIGVYGILALGVAGVLLGTGVAKADINSNYWIQNAPNSLSTNAPGGIATADIHVAHCYIGTGTSTPCSTGGGGASLTANQTFTGQNTFSNAAPLQVKNFETTLYADQFTGADICAKANAAYASASTGTNIVIPSGSYTCTTGLAQTTLNKKATFMGTSGAGTQITYTGTGSALTINNAGTGAAQYSFYAAKDLTLIGSDNSSTSTQVGVTIGGANGAPGAIFDDVNVSGFGKDVATGQNAYDITYQNSILRNGYMNLYIATPNNSGESMRFNNMFIVDPAANRATDCVVSDTSGTATLEFNLGSFDSCQVHIKGSNYNVLFNGIHSENPGNTLTGPYDYYVLDSSVNSNILMNGGTMYNGAAAPNTPVEFISGATKLTLTGVSFGSNSSVAAVPTVYNMTGTNAQLNWTGPLNTSGNAAASLAITSVNTIPFSPKGYADYNGDISSTSYTAVNTQPSSAYYNTADQTTNFEKGTADWSGNVFRILTTNGGSGTLRDAIFGNSGRFLRVTATSSSAGFYQMIAGTASGANTVGVGESYTFTPSSGVNIGHSMTLTANQTGTAGYTALQINAIETSVGSGVKKLIDAIVGASSVFSVDDTGAVLGTSYNGVALTTGGSATAYLNGSGTYTTPAGTTYTAGSGLTLTGGAFSVNAAQSLTSLTLTNTSATGLAVGAAGTTNPVFAVDSSVASQADGIVVQGKAAGVGTTITATSSGANSGVTINSIGTGVSAINATSSGSVQLQIGGGSHFRVDSVGLTGTGRFSQTDQVNSGQTTRFLFTGAADTGITPNGEASSVNFNIAQTRQWAGGTGFALQRAFRIQQPTYSFASATGTITEASTFYIDGQPLAGTNAAITNAYALHVAAGTSLFGGALLNSSGGVGYATGLGAGGTVTQATSKSTGVTLNAYSGTITMNNAALSSATIASFTVTDSDMGANDVVAIQHDSGGTVGVYTVDPSNSTAGSFVVNVRNSGTLPLSEAIVLRFAIIKGSVN